jgi:hypothetical protein
MAQTMRVKSFSFFSFSFSYCVSCSASKKEDKEHEADDNNNTILLFSLTLEHLINSRTTINTILFISPLDGTLFSSSSSSSSWC